MTCMFIGVRKCNYINGLLDALGAAELYKSKGGEVGCFC